jgi:hypothetical protein
MTQDKANKIFETQIGEQLEMIYVTSDDKAFVRHGEAIMHTNDMLNGDPEKSVDTTVETWFREYKEEV